MVSTLLSITMIFLPPVLAWVIHIYLRHGEVSGKNKIKYLLLYLALLNVITFGISYLRGVKGLRFYDMTLSYKLKYMGLGCVCGFLLPFVVCLIFEEQVTIGGFKRYICRFLRDFRKYFAYSVRAAKANLRAEVTNSYLDWLWWLIEPTCMMLIYTLIFGIIFDAAEQYFPIFIYIGLTLWDFFSRCISNSVDIVRANRDIITKIYMPKYILYFSRMLVNGFKALVSLGVVLVMMIFYQVPVTVYFLYTIPVLAVLFLFTFGVGTILMHYGVYVTDLGYITGIVLSMLMYFTGTFYSVGNMIPAPFGEILEVANPVAYLIAALRDCLLYGAAPNGLLLVMWAGISIIMIALGAFTIYSNENSYVKVI